MQEKFAVCQKKKSFYNNYIKEKLILHYGVMFAR